MKNQSELFGHPKGLFYLFFAELWERFSYYGMRALLTLYMVNEFFSWMTDEAYREEVSFGIFAAYGSLVYATPVLGGMIADKFIGFKKSIMLGGILMALGHFFMAFYFDTGMFGFEATSINNFFFYAALALLIIGNGFFKPNISTMVGRLYPEGDDRRDSGFTIFYMGINAGAFLAPLACGWLGYEFGWHYGFGAAGVGMIAGLLVFMKGMNDGVFGENGNQPAEYVEKKMYGLRTDYFFYVVAVLMVPVAAFLVKNNAMEVLDGMALHSSILSLLGLIILGIIAKKMTELSRMEVFRLVSVLVLTLLITVFWSFFELAGTAITLFAERNVNLTLLNASQTNAINPGYIIFLAIPFSMMWVYLSKTQRNPITPIKFALGILQLGLGFIVFAMSAQFMDDAGKTPFMFLMIGYLLLTTGELFISPIGLSKVTELSPKSMTAFMMGVYFLSSSYAHYISGAIAKLTTSTEAGVAPEPGFMTSMIEKVTGFAGATTTSTSESVLSLLSYTSVFTQVGIVAIGMAVVSFMITPVLKKWMYGVH
ncbi:MAG: peptide MFS transporter [Flavobacteriales bacterium]